MTKQCICPHCGRIAEVRRRSNGQKLRYLYCKNKCGGLTSAAGAAELAKIEVDKIGEVGDFPKETAPVVENDPKSDIENLDPNSKTTTHWQPEPEDTPEALEGEQTDTPNQEPKSSATPPKEEETKEPGTTGLVVTLLSIFGLVGGGIWLNSKKKKG